MKNIIILIGLIFTSVFAKAQERQYVNFGTNLEKYLDSNDIFYVGVLDRKLLSEGKNGYVHRDISNLKKFDSIYGDDRFKTVPDTNNVIMSLHEMYEDKIFESENLKRALLFTSNNKSVIVGAKTFKTPNSKSFDEIILYEVVVRGNYAKDFDTYALGKKKDGTYTVIMNYY